MTAAVTALTFSPRGYSTISEQECYRELSNYHALLNNSRLRAAVFILAPDISSNSPFRRGLRRLPLHDTRPHHLPLAKLMRHDAGKVVSFIALQTVVTEKKSNQSISVWLVRFIRRFFRKHLAAGKHRRHDAAAFFQFRDHDCGNVHDDHQQDRVKTIVMRGNERFAKCTHALPCGFVVQVRRVRFQRRSVDTGGPLPTRRSTHQSEDRRYRYRPAPDRKRPEW